MKQQYKCITDLEKRLSDAVNEVVSGANAYNGEGPYRALLGDLMEEHQFDELYIPLFIEMLGERSPTEFEVDNDELILYTNYGQEEKQTETLPGPAPLPYAPERMEHLLDKALDWIGQLDTGAGLYDTLKNEIGMTDEEINLAGFELSDYFNDPDEDETSGMQME